MLRKFSDGNMRIIVVWEPILPADWRRPTTGTLSRVADPRAEQFWDPKHLVSQEIERSLAANHVSFRGHASGGDLWDLAVLYTPTASFGDALPAPAFIDGPVVDVVELLSRAMQQLSSHAAGEAELQSPFAWGLISSSR